ncbi:MAG TPA: xanthine dehydrogenase small subunit [Povalibacter sp.]
MAADSIRFLLDGEIVTANEVTATTTVLDYLRNTLGRTGTKEGCAEGDCGACTVVLGKLSADGGHVDYRAVNSCIRYLPTIDGQELVTVESLQEGPHLHPVQQALIDHHASQCGFCTPGFVMSLFALYLTNESPQREAVVDSLAGNLCRCTGDRPVIDAGCAMNGHPHSARWSRTDSQSPTRLQQLRDLRRTASLSTAGFTAPRTVDELADLLQAKHESLLLAGGTDIGLWTTKQLRELPHIVYLGGIDELQQITADQNSIRIGAAVTLTDAWGEIVRHYPSLADLALRFASPPVCNTGTLCGNIANGSPIGDSMPALIALGATVELRAGGRVRHLPLEDLYLGYQHKNLEAGEFIVSVTIPMPAVDHHVRSYKVAKRFDQDISAVCAGFMVELTGNRVTQARIALGGMAAIPARAPSVEKALVGRAWDAATIESAAAELCNDFQPLTDMRASSHYRSQAAANLLRRFFVELSGTALTSVHAVVVT